MPDISMCSGKDCKIRNQCYRYRAVPSEYRQAYFVESPYDPKTNKCRFFWQIEQGDYLRKADEI